jgi:demethylmenaquinone methyltransferase/2-methoxy-6-polyprenyl-1,4-benzoquinol methylase
MTESPLKKEEMVKQVFENIQDRYDLLDSIISAGMDQRWRRFALEKLDINDANEILDCGAGTGKLTRMIIDSCPGCRVTSLDITQSMFRPSILPETRFIVASAEDMPLESSSFNAVVSAYLTRNLGNVDNYFREAFRVLKNGGRFVNLDIYNPTLPGFSTLFRIYFYHIVPVIGNAATHSKSYTYLANSVKNFHSQETIQEKIEAAGFVHTGFKKMMGGSIGIHWGTKP